MGVLRDVFANLIVSLALKACLSSASPLVLRSEENAIPFSPGYSVQNVVDLAQAISTHSWEFGTATEALLELYDSDLAIFGDHPFEAAKALEKSSENLPKGLEYAEEKIVIGTGPNVLSDGDGAVGDPASLGVGAVLLGKKPGLERFAAAANETIQYVTLEAPRASNGAISHRVAIVELWADFVYMAPPFLAYYAADTSNLTLLHETVYQCRAYREILQNTETPLAGLWHHILGPQDNDPGLWSTGNSWAAAGMTRVLATVLKAPFLSDSPEGSAFRSTASDDLASWIKEIIDGALNAGADSYENGLIKNYYDQPQFFGETSGSMLLAATVYRMVQLRPDIFYSKGPDRKKYLKWADGIRVTIAGTYPDPISGTTLEHVDQNNGTIRPAVNPLGWGDTAPWMSGSPEGQSFGVLLYAAWRDCVFAGICQNN